MGAASTKAGLAWTRLAMQAGAKVLPVQVLDQHGLSLKLDGGNSKVPHSPVAGIISFCSKMLWSASRPEPESNGRTDPSKLQTHRTAGVSLAVKVMVVSPGCLLASALARHLAAAAARLGWGQGSCHLLKITTSGNNNYLPKKSRHGYCVERILYSSGTLNQLYTTSASHRIKQKKQDFLAVQWSQMGHRFDVCQELRSHVPLGN